MAKLITLILYLNIFTVIFSYSITFPTFNNNKAIISNVDVKSLTKKDIIEFKKLFNKIPVIIYKNQKITAEQYYKFISYFDDFHNNNISLYNHVKNSIPSVPYVELIQSKNKSNKYINLDDSYNYLWHQDVTGSPKYITPIISSMYMLSSPSFGDDTLFASYEDAYDIMDSKLKKTLQKYTVIHSNSKKRQEYSTYDYNGLRYDNKYRFKDDIFTENPLVIYSDNTSTKKTLCLNPKKFLKFKELNYQDSNDLYRHIMKKYVLRTDNVIIHHWDDYDLCIFNNRKLIHTSSPKAVYNNKDRIYLQCRLSTNYPIQKII